MFHQDQLENNKHEPDAQIGNYSRNSNKMRCKQRSAGDQTITIGESDYTFAIRYFIKELSLRTKESEFCD